MYTREQMENMNLADSYTLLYSFLAGPLLTRFGVDGERALREGTRKFGRDRAESLRKRHLEANVKINMHSLFAVGPDLPPDPRFCRELQTLNAQERVSHTLFCPMADIWKRYGVLELGRIYCEEFHNASYSHYAYGYSKVNLAKTQTQPEDGYCAFNVILRPENLPENLKPVCFEEYDPCYTGPTKELKQAYGKVGFSTLFIKLYSHIATAAIEQLGERAMDAICEGLQNMEKDAAERLKQEAKEQGQSLTIDFFSRNYPLEAYPHNESMWDVYGKNGLKEAMEKFFYRPLFQELSFKFDCD